MEQTTNIAKPSTKNNYGWALASFLCGLLIGLNLLGFFFHFSFLSTFLLYPSLILPTPALIFGIMGLRKKENKLLSILGILLSLGGFIFLALLMLALGPH